MNGGGFGAPAAGGFGKAPVGGGFGAPAAGGFGKAPAAGGFGAAAPAAGGFGAPAAGGFGAPAAGGFGKAPAAGGFGAPAPAAGGFGAPAAGGFGAPAAGGFGAPAAGGFGAPAAGGFGAPAAGGFGKAPAGGGFGAPAPAAGGFGAVAPQQTGLGVGGFGTAPALTPASGAGGFGAPAAGAAHPPPMVSYDPTRQSTTVRYLMEMDHGLNALHPQCKFRHFFYNVCTPGLGEQAISRERYAAANAGGGCKEEEWLLAQHRNPDPENMYPHPIHFLQGLRDRAAKQKEMTELYHEHLNGLTEKVRQLDTLREANDAQYHELQQDQVLLESRWLMLMAKAESIRLLGLPLEDDEQMNIIERVPLLAAALQKSGKFFAASAQADVLLESESVQCAAKQASSSSSTASPHATSSPASKGRSTSVLSGRPTTRLGAVEPHTLKDWQTFLSSLQEGLESLRLVVKRDLKDAQRVERRFSSNRK